MNIDSSWTLHLNKWGLAHPGVIKFLGDDLVYLTIGISVCWFLVNKFLKEARFATTLASLRNVILDGLVNYLLPVGIAVGISEALSAVINRSRPFMGLSGAKLVFPHGADGGMPSHHVLFMVALATCVLSASRSVALIIAVLALASGIARVAAGIHYPSDIVVGAVLGYLIVFAYQRVVIRFQRFRKV